MIYIIEGPDGAGKTTLVEQIRKSNYNAVVKHFGAPQTPEEADNYYKVYAKAINDMHSDSEVLIFDRSWYSDMVYGPVMRNRQEMTQELVVVVSLSTALHLSKCFGLGASVVEKPTCRIRHSCKQSLLATAR